MKKTLILIPAYNEGARINALVQSVRKVMPACDILVVNDGSCDDTALAAAEAGALVVSHPFNLGYGAAIQTGYKFALANDYQLLVQMDGDGQHEPASIPQLLTPVLQGETDLALGSRFLAGNSYEPSLMRRLGMGFFRGLVSRLIGQPITDSTSGFQALNHKVFGFFARGAFPCDYPDADMLVALHRAGFRISEVPVRMYDNAEGKSMHDGWKPFYYIYKMLLSILVTLLRKPHLPS